MTGRRRWADGPVDDQLAEADIQDRLALANALRQKSYEGAELPNVGGRLVGSPLARALSSAAQGIQGSGDRKAAYGMAGDLATAKRERLAQALGGAGQDKTPDGMIEFGTRLLQDPATSDVGQFYINAGQKAKDRAAAREDELTRFGRQDKVAEDRFNRSETSADRRAEAALAQQRASAGDRLSAIQAKGVRADPLPASSLQEIQYLRSLDTLPPEERDARRNEFFQVKRAQQLMDIGGAVNVMQPGQQPGAIAATVPKTLAPDKTPEHAYDVAGAKKQGEAAAGLASQQAKVPGYVGEARDLLGKNPTDSGFGTFADRLANLFGVSLPGAPEAKQLEVVGGYLTSLSPRFEGPQGVRDVEMYQQMAAQVGDSTIPVEQRKAALTTMESLVSGYGGPAKVFGGSGTPPPSAPSVEPPPGIDPEDWKYLSPEEQAAFGQ